MKIAVNGTQKPYTVLTRINALLTQLAVDYFEQGRWVGMMTVGYGA